MTSRVQELYTRLAPEYDEVSHRLLRRWFIKDPYYRRRTVKKPGLEEGDVVLDIGCGTGWNFQYLLERIGEKGRIVGIDLTQPMLKRAMERIKKKGWGNIDLIQGDASSLPVIGGFDAAVSTYVMSVVSPYEKGLREAVNTLKPEGRLAVLDVQQFHGWLRIFNPILTRQVNPYGVEYATCKDASKCMRIMRRLLKEVKLEEGYLGMLYIASGAKR